MSERLSGRVVVLSPHLDDAVLSLGGAIAEAAGRARVRVVTVLAGDPESTMPAGPWDRRAGFATAGEATRARREEDRAACAEVGAEPVWLDFGDEQYPRGGDDDRVWAAVEPYLRDADMVLAPGTPLRHPDHEWLAGLVTSRAIGADRLGLYVEQPYAVFRERPSADPRPGARPMPTVAWTALAAGSGSRRAKRRAGRAYGSQIPLLTGRPGLLWRIDRYERARGGEGVGWISRRNRCR